MAQRLRHFSQVAPRARFIWRKQRNERIEQQRV
jgi:hypothetical protein